MEPSCAFVAGDHPGCDARQQRPGPSRLPGSNSLDRIRLKCRPFVQARIDGGEFHELRNDAIFDRSPGEKIQKEEKGRRKEQEEQGGEKEAEKGGQKKEKAKIVISVDWKRRGQGNAREEKGQGRFKKEQFARFIINIIIW